MYPDISQIMPARTGLRVTLSPLQIPAEVHGNGKEWDVFTLIGTEDENGRPTTHAVSLAVTATKRQMREMLEKNARKICKRRGCVWPRRTRCHGTRRISQSVLQSDRRKNS